jgi:hypothetical protein
MKKFQQLEILSTSCQIESRSHKSVKKSHTKSKVKPGDEPSVQMLEEKKENLRPREAD